MAPSSNNHHTKKTPSRPLLIACGVISVLLLGFGFTWLIRGTFKPAPTPDTHRPAPRQQLQPGENDLGNTAKKDPTSTPPTGSQSETNPSLPESAIGDIKVATPSDPDADANPPEDNTIFAAAYYGKLDAVKKALAKEPSLLHARDKEQGATPLLWSLVKGHKSVVEYLIAQGADVNAKGKQGWTPLHRAAYIGNTELMTLLLDKGAEINAADRTHGTALLKAIGRGHEKAALLLLERHADINVHETSAGLSALHLAVLGKQKTVVEKLLALGANVEDPDKSGMSPLMYAELNKDDDLVQLLKKAGATQ